MKRKYSSCPRSLTLLIICKNNFLNIGMTHLINNLQPAILQKTGKLCDVITVNSPHQLDLSTLSTAAEYCLVIEREFFPAFNEMLITAKSAVAFKNVFFLSAGGACSTSQINFLPCKPTLNDIKKILFKIMTTHYGANLESLRKHTSCLTDNDKRLLSMIVDGKSVAEIAQVLNQSPQTVYASRTRLYAKLRVSNIQELLASGAIIGLQR